MWCRSKAKPTVVDKIGLARNLEGGMKLLRCLSSWTLQGTRSLPPSSHCMLLSSQLKRRVSSKRSLSSASVAELPHKIPNAGYVDLSSVRGLLALHGPDTARFLQGLITKIFPSESEPNGMFTSFLSPQATDPEIWFAKFAGTSALRRVHIHFQSISCRHRLRSFTSVHNWRGQITPTKS